MHKYRAQRDKGTPEKGSHTCETMGEGAHLYGDLLHVENPLNPWTSHLFQRGMRSLQPKAQATSTLDSGSPCKDP